jgi:hypothetical protein
METSNLKTLKIKPRNLNELYVHEFGFCPLPIPTPPSPSNQFTVHMTNIVSMLLKGQKPEMAFSVSSCLDLTYLKIFEFGLLFKAR